ncbi:hypothetical protein EUGRSUZ_G02201 [Eucalyptus grandis]|uniref:Uncharacterized protein n=2 Tax=Eucalyptus grandis TaxID=71139 RepID=A0ACC3K6L2_EUCGR|nr:hypothetical protein EUGRSUZ_G02201 [Eucalyptus grandis]
MKERNAYVLLEQCERPNGTCHDGKLEKDLKQLISFWYWSEYLRPSRCTALVRAHSSHQDVPTSGHAQTNSIHLLCHRKEVIKTYPEGSSF